MRLTPLLVILIAINAFGQDTQGLRFIQNKGQWNEDSDFQAQIPGGRLGISATGFSILLLDMEEIEHQHMASHQAFNESNGHTDPVDGHYFRINLLGADPYSKPVVDNPLDGHYNYYLGNDPSRWASSVKAYATVFYPEVYKGIGFRVSSAGNNLKYDFIVKPGADPAQIKIQYEGVDGVFKEDGELKIHTVLGPLTEMKPFSYHVNGSDKQAVASSYRLQDNIASFSFPEGYDASRTLIIDPLLIFSTYSGSTADNWGSTATPGERGTLYSAGVTRQDLGGFFPATPGAFQSFNQGNFDMGIIKYDSAGTRFIYATHLGGTGNDSPESLVVDHASGELLVLGITSSSNFPTTDNAFDDNFNSGTTILNRVLNTDDPWDIVVTRFSIDGSTLVGSTYLGGSGNDGFNFPKQSGGALVQNYGDEMRGDIITDASGYVYISSVTSSADFPVMNAFDSFGGGITDGLVVKLTPDLSSIVWSSYVGGSGFDAAYSIKFDSNNNIVLAGGTTSTDFPVTPGAYQDSFNGIVDGWIARIAADGSAIMNATFTGTNSFDQVYFVDLNASDNVFVYGQTAGAMPVTPGVFNNPNTGQFLQKFSPDLTTLEFSTVFGSASPSGLIIPNISPTAFMVNDCDNIYMAGWGGVINVTTGFWQSSTNGMPITNDAFQKNTSGSDFYFMVLNGDATTLVYSTYLGGNSSKTHVDGGTSRFDKYGIVYHSVCSGCTANNTEGHATSDFPTTPKAHSRFNNSANCNNAAFKFDLSSLRAMFDTNNLALTEPGYNNVCYPEKIVFQNLSTGGRTIEWDFDDGTILQRKDTDPKNVIHQFKQEGQYRVKLKITDLSTCSQVDSITRVINYFEDNIEVGPDAFVCEGSNFRLTASGGATYSWTSEDGTFTSSEASPVITPLSSMAYYITAVDSDGCSRTDTVNISFVADVRAAFQTYDAAFKQPGYNNVCFPDPIRFKNQSTNGEMFTWDFDDGTTRTQNLGDTISLLHVFPDEGVYQVKLKAINLNSCNKEHSVTKTINYFKDNIQVVDDGEICEGSSFELSATGATTFVWRSEDNTFHSTDGSPVVDPSRTTKYFVTARDVHGCEKKDTVEVFVINSVKLEWEHHLDGSCADRPFVYVKNLTPQDDNLLFHFDFGDGKTSEETEVEHVYETDGLYTVKLVVQNRVCVDEKSVEFPVYKMMVPNVFTPDDSPGKNDYFRIGMGDDLVAPADVGMPVHLVVVDRWGNNVFESKDYKNDWNGHDVSGGIYYAHVKVGHLSSCKTWVHVVK